MDTTHVIIWIAIILVAILLVWLLRKWIKRLIFIILILWLAFFIFGLFNPSGASRLWYNIKTFPDRVVSRFSDKSFLDYDGYLSKNEGEIWEKIDFKSDDKGENVSEKLEDTENTADEKNINKGDGVENGVQSGQSFVDSLNKVLLPELSESEIKNNTSVNKSSDEKVMKALEEYLWKNLDENTDILVTMEYSEDWNRPEKIIFRTQEKSHFSAVQHIQRKSNFSLFRWIKKDDDKLSEKIAVQSGVITELKPVPQTLSKSYNWLTQNEIKETEELFSILFG